jgi:hypothetical protein
MIRSILFFANGTWTMSKKLDMTLEVFERKILRIDGPIQENYQWKIGYNNEIYG